MKLSFPNARANLWDNCKTISGFDPGADFDGSYFLYTELFCHQLTLLGYTSEKDYSFILSQMNAYEDVSDFLGDQKTQLAELAAFGLILFERIIQAIAANASHKTVFDMHENLAECLAYAIEDAGIRRRARDSAKARHSENHALKADVFKWLDTNNTGDMSMDDIATTIAEKVVPLKFRTVRDYITEWKKLRSASRP